MDLKSNTYQPKISKIRVVGRPVKKHPVVLLTQATLEVYRQLKDEYFGFVRQAGELDLQLKEMEEELTSAHQSLGRKERELWDAEDKNGPRKKNANPWQVNI